MAWFKVDDSMPFNTKTLMCSLEAIGLWVLAGAWASQQLTNGQVPKQVLPALRANEDVAAELVQAGLWIEDKENSKYYFHDWEKYNPTSEEVLDLRAKRAEAGRKGGIASAVAKRQASAKQTPEQNESNVQPRPVPSRPDPSHPFIASAETTSSRKKVSTSMPKTWKPNDSHVTKVTEAGLKLTFLVEQFTNNAIANDKKFVDWDRAFHTWINNAIKWDQEKKDLRAAPAVSERDPYAWMDRKQAGERGA